MGNRKQPNTAPTNQVKPTPLIESGTWWALVRGPRALPVVFASKQDAEENRDHDEYLVEVHIDQAQP